MEGNYYDDSVEFEKKCSPLLNNGYRTLWPKVVSMKINTDKEFQYRGIDRYLYFDSGLLKIEEKIRRIWKGDILLEYMSNDITKSEGWMNRNLECDYIIYAVLPINVMFWFNWADLKHIWEINKSIWISAGENFQHGFSKITADNKDKVSGKHLFNTLSVGVPPECLIKNTRNGSTYIFADGGEKWQESISKL